MTFEEDSPTLKKLQATSSRTARSSRRTATCNSNSDQSQTHVVSTNVSSPVFPLAGNSRQGPAASRAGASRRRRVPDSSDVESDGEDDYAPAVRPDDTTVQVDSLGMPMVRRGGSTRRTSPVKTVGTPITSDSLTANLNSYEVDIMNRFLIEAKKLRGEIANKKGLRNESIFTDTILRKIGIVLPTSEPHPFIVR